ncbi:hypothetical protein, partial [Flavobacterium cellulosilyticum]
MKERLKRVLLFARNRWGISNSIKKSKESKVLILGNLLHTRIRAQGNCMLVIEKGCRIRNASIEIKGTNNRILIKEDVFFSGNVSLIGDGNELTIGNNTRINGADFNV